MNMWKMLLYSQPLPQLLANAELTTLPNAGHMAEAEQPDALAALIREFLG